MSNLMGDFGKIVKATPEIQDCYQRGLQALGSYSDKIKPRNSRLCQGSVFLEECILHKYHGENLWDYLLAYDGKVYFVEIHPAQTSEVETVLKKFEWLKSWLSLKAESIDRIKADQPFYWIASGKFAILPNSPQYRRIIQRGLKPMPVLSLS